MSGNKTFSMIKPGAVRNKHIGHILSKIEEAGYTIAAIKTTRLTIDQAADFYSVHKDRPFFQELIEFMSSDDVPEEDITRSVFVSFDTDGNGVIDFEEYYKAISSVSSVSREDAKKSFDSADLDKNGLIDYDE
ncbi:MAG: nucleoside-diphosphate kinase, partial [Bacteroidales bacterium]|nr:nucleoside-diphosphate kinase [Bacteroidales bacterium]